jgi:hypothetical protein
MRNIGKELNGKLVYGILALTLVISIEGAHSQPTRPGLRITFSSCSTGSGFGATYNTGLALKKDRHQFEASIEFQKRELNRSGGQLTYEFSIFDGTRDGEMDAPIPCEMFLVSNVRYTRNAMLGKGQMQTEMLVANDVQSDLHSLRFSTVEGYLGFGIKVKIIRNIYWVNAIGIGGWMTLEGTKKLYREYQSQSISLKTGFTFDISRKGSNVSFK